MKSPGTLTEAGKRIELLERQLGEAIKARNILILLGKVSSDDFEQVESIVRNCSTAREPEGKQS